MCSKIELDVKMKIRFYCYASVTIKKLEMKTVQLGNLDKVRIPIVLDGRWCLDSLRIVNGNLAALYEIIADRKAFSSPKTSE